MKLILYRPSWQNETARVMKLTRLLLVLFQLDMDVVHHSIEYIELHRLSIQLESTSAIQQMQAMNGSNGLPIFKKL